MKKFVSIILALTMVLALGISAFADSYSDTDERTQSTVVSLDLGSACATWSIPASLELTANKTSDTGTVEITEWKVDAGERWEITCSGDQITFGENDEITANVLFNTVVADSSSSTSQDITVSFAGYDHLAGSYESNISFTLSYSGEMA